MGSAALKCWNCGNDLIDIPRPISRHEQCQSCFEPLHCCRLCRHYRPKAAGQCDEERADPPVIKENANFCDWFKPDPEAFSGERVGKSSAASDKLNALFGNEQGDADDPEDQVRSRLDDLFSRD